MDNYVTFQGHTFIRRKDGLYECNEEFEFDEKNWAHGENYIGYIVLLHRKNGKEYPYLISIDAEHVDLITSIHHKNRGGVKIAPSYSLRDSI